MICLFCSSPLTSVFNSRTQKKEPRVWRRRSCENCSRLFTTHELPEYAQLVVLKRSGKNQKFSKPKLFVSIYKSLEHLPKAAETADAISSTVIARVLMLNTPLSSELISEVVMNSLKNYNVSAFVKYASLQSSVTNKRELNRLLKMS